MPKKFYHLFIIGLWLLLSACLPENPADTPASSTSTAQPPASTPIPSATLQPSRTSQPTFLLPTFTQTLEEIAGVEINTFAYPYGLTDNYLKQFVHDCGYFSGAGLEPAYHHTLEDIFYFQRLPVDGKWSLADFASRLPWKKL